MKKIITLALFLGSFAVTSSYAQLKVASTGKVGIGTNAVPQSLLTVSGTGDSTYTIHSIGSRLGIYCRTEGDVKPQYATASEFRSVVSSGRNFHIGVNGVANSMGGVDVGIGRAYGVIGNAGQATQGWNYGVFGKLGAGNSNGAGIYGTSDVYDNGTCLNGRYAGYFKGNVIVTGNLTISGKVNGVVLGPSLSLSSQLRAVASERAVESVADNLSGLEALTFYHPAPARAMSENLGDTAVAEPTVSHIEAQNLTKMHYALSADQLGEIYPDLVYEDEDGAKCINYMEMIPLLVQSIGELNARIAELETANGKLRAAAKGKGTTGTDGMQAGSGIATASLSQNVPNPFTVNTDIKMNIPETVAKAFLCIYDMSGKQLRQEVISGRGETSFTVSAEDLGSGMYLYSLITDGMVVETKRMVINR